MATSKKIDVTPPIPKVKKYICKANRTWDAWLDGREYHFLEGQEYTIENEDDLNKFINPLIDVLKVIREE